ncbi:hypothetical protein RB195_014631 [Necator americanus]|uniref:Uncharacterized protein n=1 Tax=Necator americanus TaxID=51031 RepID=A0ABR1E111_NECAM
MWSIFAQVECECSSRVHAHRRSFYFMERGFPWKRPAKNNSAARRLPFSLRSPSSNPVQINLIQIQILHFSSVAFRVLNWQLLMPMGFGADRGGDECPDEVTGSRKNRQDGREIGTQHNQHRSILRRNLLPANDDCTVIYLSYVATSALGLLQSNYIEFDALCSFQKGSNSAVCGHCSRIVNTQSETVSMASRACINLAKNRRRTEEPKI